MPPSIDIMTEVGVARAHNMVRDKHRTAQIDQATGCWLFSGSKNTDGYGQIFGKKNSDMHRKGRSSQTAFLIHKVSFVAFNQRNPQHHVSHLCDVRACFNPEHLVDETPIVNNSRKGCPGPVFCKDHGHLLVDLCTHSPKCIRGRRPDTNCCLSIARSSPAWGTIRHSSSAAPSSSAGPSRQASNVSGTSTVSQLNIGPPNLTAEAQPGVSPSPRMLAWQRTASSQFSGASELEAAVKAGEL